MARKNRQEGGREGGRRGREAVTIKQARPLFKSCSWLQLSPRPPRPRPPARASPSVWRVRKMPYYVNCIVLNRTGGNVAWRPWPRAARCQKKRSQVGRDERRSSPEAVAQSGTTEAEGGSPSAMRTTRVVYVSDFCWPGRPFTTVADNNTVRTFVNLANT